ncbi:MAG: hypothetical protein ABIP74_04610 [Candidatus Saccharimonas sp.]
MGYEITCTPGRTLKDSEILATLRRDYPDKDFSIHNGTITESYRIQPDYKTMLQNSPWRRAKKAVAELAVAAVEEESSDDYIGRVMSNQV